MSLLFGRFHSSGCYTEKAPNAWHRRGTHKLGVRYFKWTQSIAGSLRARPGCPCLTRTSRCVTEKATPARHHPECQYNACANRRKQSSPDKTKSYSNPTPPRKRQNNPINGHTSRCVTPRKVQRPAIATEPVTVTRLPVPGRCSWMCASACVHMHAVAILYPLRTSYPGVESAMEHL